MSDNETTAAPVAKEVEPTKETQNGDSTNQVANSNGDERRDRGNRNPRGRGSRFSGTRTTRAFKRNKEYDDMQETEDPDEMRAQVEFYFSTINLSSDEHMFTELGGPKNQGVSIKHLHTFKRMRRFPSYSGLVEALRASEDLIVEGEGGRETVKRREPIPVPEEEGDAENPPTTVALFHRLRMSTNNNMETSIYAKGFDKEKEPSQIALEKHFRKYGGVMVRKRREDSDNAFKGSVFVAFDSEDSKKQFLAIEDSADAKEEDKAHSFNGTKMELMDKRDYIIMKCKEKGIKPDWELTEEERREKNRQNRSNGFNRDSRGRGRGGDRGSRGGRGRGGRGGRGGHGRRDNYDRRDRSRSPRRRNDRDRSVDSSDWNTRRDRDNRDRREPRDNKRKADGEADAGSPKKSKIELKEDE